MTYISWKLRMSLRAEVYDWLEARATRTEIDKRLKMTLYFIKKNQHFFSFYRSSSQASNSSRIPVPFRCVYTPHGFKRWQGLIRHNDFPAAIYESTLAARQIARTPHTEREREREHTVLSNVYPTRVFIPRHGR